MTVEQLRAFLAVAEELHFGRAAHRLHIAQPSLSRIVKQLEHELQTELLRRSTRSVRLTASGAALVDAAREVLAAMGRAEEVVVAAEHGEVGTVRIAFAGISTYELIARLARSIRATRPGIKLDLSSQNFALSTMRLLVEDGADIALGRWDVFPAEIEGHVVSKDVLVMALPDTHRLAGAKRLSMRQLHSDHFIVLPPEDRSVLTERLHRLGEAFGFVPSVVQVAPDTQTALALVGAEVGCHLTVSSVASTATTPHVRFVPLSDAGPDVHLRAAWRRDEPSPAVRVVRTELLRLARETAAAS